MMVYHILDLFIFLEFISGRGPGPLKLNNRKQVVLVSWMFSLNNILQYVVVKQNSCKVRLCCIKQIIFAINKSRFYLTILYSFVTVTDVRNGCIIGI